MMHGKAAEKFLIVIPRNAKHDEESCTAKLTETCVNANINS